MSRREDLATLREQGLLPFQAQVVNDFLKPGSDRVWEVASPPGTGKTRLARALVRHFLADPGMARVLILVPSALRVMWTEQLNDMGLRALWVDRRKLVELSAAADAEPLWPARTAVVMSIDLAKREDVLAALKTVDWDLAIADESHLLAGKRADAFFGLLEEGRAKRGLLLTSLPSTEPLPFPLPIARRTFGWDQIKDWEGRPLFLPQRPTVTFVTYERSAEEAALLRDLETLAASIPNVLPLLRFQATLVVRAASSSLYAAEQHAWQLQDALMRIRNVVAHGRIPNLPILVAPEDETSSDALDLEIPPATQVQPEARAAVVELTTGIGRILERFERIPGDPKLERLRQLLGGALRVEQAGHACIWTGFVSTSQYLTTALEEGRSPVFRVTASMGRDERAQRVDQFRAEGGVLITSGPAIEGLSLPFVDTCIHYDLPVDARTLALRLGAFLRYGRTKPFSSVVLRDAARSLAWEETLFQKVTSTGES